MKGEYKKHMLKEFLNDHLTKAREELTEVMKQYKAVCEEEKVILENIEKTEQNADIDFEIFSPRSGDSLKDKLSSLNANLKTVREKKEQVKKEIDRISGDLENYKVMMAEYIALEKKGQSAAGNKNLTRT
ncbi:MAG TPA: hypothetical protein IAB44_09535 [Candidatus Limivivens intestinipullorum]|uniref:Uncharacterized protein n=1 Tax=Candidatus Limivivens intestinipullorum TaxID=2840858 RepID=A0A9D1ETQ9_9FIRM|nr:hypothetical protein [Candidatus Limivivens intestinipullorum]